MWLRRSIVKEVNCLLFADDIALFPRVNGSRDHRALVSSLSSAKWASKWNVVFSQSKSQVVCFNSKKFKIDLPSFLLGDITLQVVREYKYLGLAFKRTAIGILKASPFRPGCTVLRFMSCGLLRLS